MKALNAVNFEKFSVSCRQIDLDANSGAKDEICTIDVIVINQVKYLLHEVVNNGHHVNLDNFCSPLALIVTFFRNKILNCSFICKSHN